MGLQTSKPSSLFGIKGLIFHVVMWQIRHLNPQDDDDYDQLTTLTPCKLDLLVQMVQCICKCSMFVVLTSIKMPFPVRFRHAWVHTTESGT